jgi:hypothetical protein
MKMSIVNSGLVRDLAKAAGIGALIGIGGAFIKGDSEEKLIKLGVISSVALRMIHIYLGAGAAVGTFLGACGGYIFSLDSSDHRYQTKAILGGILVGGALGYLGDLAKLRTKLVVVL